MAIKPTPNNDMFKSLVFDGVDSRDYGIYITGDAVFNSPDRDVEMIEIPGRNGAYVLDKGRFRNIKVSYPAGIAGDTEADFREGISAFRNALASRKGYKRLEDDYNPDEYRMAVYKSGLEVTPKALKAGEFTISFDAKPQRFLKSGETAVTIGGSVTNTQTESGSIVSIESDGGDAVTSLVAQITPIQAGSGDPSPTNVRAITGWTAANVNVAGKNLIGFKSLLDKWGSGYTDLGDGSYNVRTTGTGYREPFRFASEDIDVTLSGEITQLSGASGWRFQLLNSNDETVAELGSGSTALSGKGCKLRLNYVTSAAVANFKNIQVELGTAATSYEPYKGTTTTTALGRTVYGGTVDVVTGAYYGGTVGVLTVTHEAEIFNGTESWGSEQTSGELTNYYLNLDNASKMTGRQGGLLDDELLCNWLAPSSSIATYSVYVDTTSKYLNCKCSSASDVTAFKSMLTATPLVVVYPLATPQTYQLTAQQVELLTGQNHVWADTGDITITWGDDPNKLVNPTLYDSHPLLHVWGYGDIDIGGGTLSINNDEYGRTLLANRLSKSATSVLSYLDESAVLMLNSGDDVFVSAGSSVVFPLTLLNYASINITSATIANSSPYDFPMESSVSNFGNYVTVSVSLPQLDFIFNQTLQHLRSNIRVTINYTEAGVSKTSTAECQIHAQYSLTPLGRYTVALFYYDEAVDKFYNPGKAVMTIQPIYGVSTQRPFSDDADFYFDLDIGEAYKIEDGQIISVNNAVTIPAQLPTLKSGANTIAYDDTITQFKVVPRWWEV